MSRFGSIRRALPFYIGLVAVLLAGIAQQARARHDQRSVAENQSSIIVESTHPVGTNVGY